MDQLAEGKPINQANALLHCTSEIVMVNDCNQGADLEQWFFLPQLLNEFHTDGNGRHHPDKRVRIVGFRENIFTENEGIVGRSGALNEFTFGTIIQRELHVTLGARLHYGHPDCFDFCFVIAQGGMSKMSKTINVSEDIFGGMNVVARGGKIDYVDYMHIDKGRDVQYDAALGFEGKIAGGTSVHTLSRDYHRLMASPLAFFHKLSLYVGAFGYFFSNTLLVTAIILLCYLHALVSLLPEGEQFLVYSYTDAFIPLLNIGCVYLFALIVQLFSERGIKRALLSVYSILNAIPLSLCKMKTHHYYVHRGLALGLAKYVATGRDLPTKRVNFVNTFTRYSISHLSPAIDLGAMLLIMWRYSAMGGEFYFQSTISLWVATIAWLFGPAIYNPFAFTYKDIFSDLQGFSLWMRSEAFDDWFYGQQASASTGDLSHNNWFSWLNAEPTLAKTCMSLFNLVLYFTICGAIGLRLEIMTGNEPSHMISVHGEEWQNVLVVCLCILLFFAARTKFDVMASVVSFILIVILVLLVYRVGPVAAFSQVLLFVYVAGKALLAFLQLCLVIWQLAAPISSVMIDTQCESIDASPSSRSMLMLPRQIPFLTWGPVLAIAKLHAWLIALVYFACAIAFSVICAIPLSILSLFLFVYVVQTTLYSSLYQSELNSSLLVMLSLLVISTSAAFVSLNGLQTSGPRGRYRAAFSQFQYVLVTLNLGSLHNWLLMNRAVAHHMAERAAVKV